VEPDPGELEGLEWLEQEVGAAHHAMFCHADENY